MKRKIKHLFLNRPGRKPGKIKRTRDYTKVRNRKEKLWKAQNRENTGWDGYLHILKDQDHLSRSLRLW